LWSFFHCNIRSFFMLFLFCLEVIRWCYCYFIIVCIVESSNTKNVSNEFFVWLLIITYSLFLSCCIFLYCYFVTSFIWFCKLGFKVSFPMLFLFIYNFCKFKWWHWLSCNSYHHSKFLQWHISNNYTLVILFSLWSSHV
jgi:hypothetical protein